MAANAAPPRINADPSSRSGISLSPNVTPLSPANAAQLDPQALLKSNDTQLVRALEVLNAVAAK